MLQRSLIYLSLFRTQFPEFLGYFLITLYLYLMNPIRCFSAILVFFSFSILLAQDPPASNTYQTATTLTLQDGSCTYQTQGDLTHASSSNNLNYLSQDCFYGNDHVTEYAAVWY